MVNYETWLDMGQVRNHYILVQIWILGVDPGILFHLLVF